MLAAFFASIALTWLWIAASPFYCLAMFLFGAMQGEGVRAEGPWNLYAMKWHTLAPVVGFSAPVFLVWGLLWAQTFRKQGRYARSLAAQALPLTPFVLALILMLTG
jgi:hypothetical protein